MPQAHPAFELLRTEAIPTLHLTLEEYRHRETGAVHLHLAADDPHNAFLIAFRTVPQDSTGVAHILEHTALCGSERYPVRDPFFMMTRRSLNTFMNAFTGADWTGYPFASQNRKDFDNLLQVYLDAVFFPKLEELDFAQEGHRVEFAKAEDPASGLEFKGVVYNEMKGAMSSAGSVLWQSFTRELFPTITYHHNSGGDPAHIPELSHAQLKEFHRTHYHPSNALILTYGDIPAADHQARCQELALERFEALDVHFEIPDERRYDAPRQVEERYSLAAEEELTGKTHVVLGWLLGRNNDMHEVMEAHLLSGVLLDNSASPLRQLLETSELGSAPSPLCGVDDSPREMLFACGLEGCEPERAEAVERVILDELERIAAEGVPFEMVESVLHQLELHQREIGGDHFPYGLQLLMNAMGPAIHGGDAAQALEIDPILARLREEIQDPGYLKGLVRTLLLDNPHRLRLTLRPDHQLNDELEAAEQDRLAEIEEGLDEAGKRAVIERAATLKARQEQQDDPEILPKVGIEDVPAELHIAHGEERPVAGMAASWYDQGTNGLAYQELLVELPPLTAEQLDLLPLYTAILTEVGSAGRDYLETQTLQAAVTGGLHARLSLRGGVDDVQQGRGYLILAGKALARNQAHLSALIQETLERPRFDELKRVRELIAQERAGAVHGVTGRGHSLAMTAAASGLSPSAALSHRWRGLLGIHELKALDRRLEQTAELEGFAARLEELHRLIQGAPRRLLAIGEGETLAAMETELARLWAACPAPADHPPLTLEPVSRRIHEGWTTSTQVNFCARVYPTVPASHPDAPALWVLGEFLRNNHLHRVIREQGGAYGGGAGYDTDSGGFRFYSYRDPRLTETLADFDRSVTWLLENRHQWRLVEEAILGIVSRIDHPASPAGEARSAYYNALHGRTPEHRKRIRQGVLEVRETDLKRVAETYLKPERANTAVVGSSANLEAAAELGLEVKAL